MVLSQYEVAPIDNLRRTKFDENQGFVGDMVKEASTKKRKRGPDPRPEEVRTERLTLRVHPDLMEILTARARERGVSRSQYIEKLLIGWTNADPRNVKVDSIGKIISDAADPATMRMQN